MAAESEKVYILFDGGDDLRLPAVLSIAPRLPSEVTTNPVEPAKSESGSQVRTDVTDNTRPGAKTLSLEIFVSELIGQEENEAYDPDFAGDHIKVRERLELARDNGELLHIDLGADKGLYPDMLILEFDPTWERGKGKSLWAALQLQQITFATTKVRKAPAKTNQTPPVDPNSKLLTQGANGKDLGFNTPVEIKAGRLDAQTLGATSFLGVEADVNWARGLAN
jgi:hypothetical protein